MKHYDILVIGGGTSGCACAYIAAKYGLRVLLLEEQMVLGGAMTSGLVIPVMYNGDNQINTEFFEDLISELKKFGGQITYQKNPGWFNPELLKIVLDKMLIDVGVKILFSTEVKNVEINSNNIAHAEISNKTLSTCNSQIHSNNAYHKNNNTLSECIEADYFVDATGNGNFCKKINCEILKSTNDFQPMTLRFIMSGIDLKTFSKFLLQVDTDRNVTTVEHIDGQIHLSTACTWDSDRTWALAPFFAKGVEEGCLKDSDRNYFQVFSIAGMPDSLAFNCPRIPESLNPHNYNDISKALIEGRAGIYRLAEFCKKHFPGFENAFISNISDVIGVRALDRIRGKYVYKAEDLRSGKKFDNPALISSYPIDIHSANKGESTLEKTGEYQLPI